MEGLTPLSPALHFVSAERASEIECRDSDRPRTAAAWTAWLVHETLKQSTSC